MNFRKSVKSDMPEIMKIIKQAQDYFKDQGINQWQNNYPNEEVISNDILRGDSYILENNGTVVATTVISFEKEKNYNTIYNGKWITNEEYAVIHRIAVDNNSKGLGVSHFLINYAKKLCMQRGVNSIKVDTHHENIPMRKLLQSSGFKYCGIIHLEDGAERMAFEKVL